MSIRTLLFTDLVDSTQLVERLGDARAAELWALHDRRARDLLARHHGREIDRTDGFFLLFDRPPDAACFALAYHQALAELTLSARVGIHVGAVSLRENAPRDVARGAKPIEVEGLAKPFAARVMGLACGGQTLLSAAARAALGDRALPEGSAWASHGHYRLKGIEEPAALYELGWRDGTAFAPPPDTDKVYRVVNAGGIWQPLREVRHNLAPERDAFIGRNAELRALAQRFDAGARLLTVLGPGGTGKTRLLCRYGRMWLGDWSGGVAFCDLSEARSLEGICFAVALALGVPLGDGDPALQLGHAIAGRGRCLVILDNFEQVVAHAPATLGRWLDRAAEASFAVSSRERLQLAGEEVFAVEPLPLDDDAIELFATRARAQQPAFTLGPANRAPVAEVVRLLDGLPLAIELAAARVRVLSPAQIVERLKDRFKLLAGARGADARQATLKAAIDWSWDLLAPWEQAALAQCAVFEGGFTLEAAESVLDLAHWPEAPPAMDTVQALADKSLLRTWHAAESGRHALEEPYFGMYLSIHEYAAAKLDGSRPGATRAAQERHGRWFAGFGSESALEALFHHGGTARLAALAFELDNLVAACRRAVVRGDGETAVAVYRAAWEVLDRQGPFGLGVGLGEQVLAIPALAAPLRALAGLTAAMAWRRVGRVSEADAALQEALAQARQAGTRSAEGRILGQWGRLRGHQGHSDEALAHTEAALAIHRALGERRAEGDALGSLAIWREFQGATADALAHYEAALAIHREVGDRRAEGVALGNLGALHFDQGRFGDSRRCCEAALALQRAVGDRHGEALTLGSLGTLNTELGRHDEALTQHQAALAIAREIGSRRDEGVVLGGLGNLHFSEGRWDEAGAHYDAALAIHREVGNRSFEGEALANLGELMAVQGRLSEAREVLRAGEALLREIDDPMLLAQLLCTRGLLEIGSGQPAAARAALAEGETVAAALRMEPDSPLGQELAKLRLALEG